ncbi:epigen isoform X2 [Petaurus breviceps papuanus]|uniref:epigen isoform X2 n=1 Tax=Petaurus breviceps papuanus TaxID=3040969 RepID=UPI0036DBC30D
MTKTRYNFELLFLMSLCCYKNNGAGRHWRIIQSVQSDEVNWPSSYSDQESEYTEGLIALKFSHPCLADHHSYCINGICVFHHELKKAICRCTTGYTGERCEHLTLNSYAVDSYEKYIAVGIGVGLLLSLFLALIYCYVRKRYGSRRNVAWTALY